MILFVDTETTGFIDFKKEAMDPSQPRLVQLAMALEAPNGRVVGALALLIKPSRWAPGPVTIGDDVVAVHGITTEMAEQYGVEPEAALEAFLDFYQKAEMMVAHNESFDWKALRASLHAQGKIVPDKKPSFCTMHKSTALVGLPPSDKMMATGRKSHKVPTLGEAYQFFTGQQLAGSHDALADVYACRRIYKAILAAGGGQAAEPPPAGHPAAAPARRAPAATRRADTEW